MSFSAYALSYKDWETAFTQRGLPLTKLSYWVAGIYKDPSLMHRHVSETLLASLKQHYSFALPEIVLVQRSDDGTAKFQMRLHDNLEVETVLIPFFKRFTICLSTQVGCAMNCSFCFTGTQGLKRNLAAAEIVGQYLRAQEWLLKEAPRAIRPSIVFMGQGEPLHNVYEVKKATEVLSDPKCVGVGVRQMTLSTVGYMPGMKELKNFPKINIALSLHSPFDQERNKLIPVNQSFPLEMVLKELDGLKLLKRQFITIEYLMIKGFNMSNAHVEALAAMLKPRPAIINLIPFNPFPGSIWERPTGDEVENFRKKLVEKRLRVMVRNTKGDNILAACGQLRIEKMARNNGT